MRKRNMIISCLGLMFLSMSSGFAAKKERPAEAAATPNQLGVLVPYYNDPTPGAIKPMITAAQANPNVPLAVILNPDNGVGGSKQTVYVNGTKSLQAANISVLGYVYTSSGGRPLSAVEGEIKKWVTWYNVDGIFLDEMKDSLDLNYYQSITSYAKALGCKIVMGNPGDNDLPTTAGPEVDTIIVYEDGGVPKNLTQFNKWQKAGYSPSKIGLISYNVKTLPTSFISQAQPVFGWIYITNENLPNPYEGLPSYFQALMSDINSLNP